MRAALEASPTAYMEVGIKSGADYLLSDRPQDKTELEKLGRIVWENAHYVLVRLFRPQHEGAPSASAALPAS